MTKNNFNLDLFMQIQKENLIFKQMDNLLFLDELKEKYHLEGKIKTIYIDPPFTTQRKFNSKKGNQFAYDDLFTDESFLEFLEERIKKAYPLISEDGFLFLHIDNKIGHYVKIMLDKYFGKENFVTNIITARIKKNDKNVDGFNESYDHLLLYRKSPSAKLKSLYKKSKKKPYWHSLEASGQGDGKFFNGVFIEPSKGNHWRWSQKRIDEEFKNGTLRINKKGKPEYLVVPTQEKIDNNWTDVAGYSFKHDYPTEKHPEILRRVIECSSEEKDIILDFFAGSGTTLDIALEMNRFAIGCDKGDLSANVIQERLKKY